MTHTIDSKFICKEELQVLQAYVQLMHAIVSEQEVSSPIGYLYCCERGKVEREIMKYVPVDNGDGTYRSVRLIETPEKLKEIIDNLKNECEKYKRRNREDSAVYKLCKSEVLRLESGEKITDCIKYIGRE